jgi:hypothetical protein
VQGRIGAANAAEFFGVLRELQAGTDVVAKLLAAAPGADTVALLPRTLDGLYGMVYGLLAAAARRAHAGARAGDRRAAARARSDVPLPLREAQTLAMELLMRQALERGLETTILDSPAYRRYAERRRGLGG